MAFNWTCPFCNRDQAVSSSHYDIHLRRLLVEGTAQGEIGLQSFIITCANRECRQPTITVRVAPISIQGGEWKFTGDPEIFGARIIPASSAKPQPDCIPAALREDYREACLIADASPKAAATLARRCLQGMIRDFCKISDRTLDLEIKRLRAAVDEQAAPAGVTHEAVDAIDHVRSVGNIGAHMERDIDLIVPVEPDEARLLIELVEMLFSEWYVARDARQKRLTNLAELAASKKEIRAQLAAPQLPPANSLSNSLTDSAEN